MSVSQSLEEKTLSTLGDKRVYRRKVSEILVRRWKLRTERRDQGNAPARSGPKQQLG